MTTDDFFTIERAAQHLGVSARTLRRWIKAGKLEAQLKPGPYGQQYLVPRDSVAGIEVVRDVERAERRAERESIPQVLEAYLQEREGALARELKALRIEFHAAIRRMDEQHVVLLRYIEALDSKVQSLQTPVPEDHHTRVPGE